MKLLEQLEKNKTKDQAPKEQKSILIKKALSWIGVIFLAISGLVYLPHFSSFALLLAVILLLPIQKWQDFINSRMHKWLKISCTVGLILVFVFAMPTTSPDASINDPDADTTLNDADDFDDIVATHTHSFSEATCTAPKTCSCGATEGVELGHSWKAATCTSPKTCEFCDLSDGVPADHEWTPATCLAPETCTLCKSTKGDVLSHNWKSASCSSPATCSLCGETEGTALDHNYSNGKCMVCNADEPRVWITTSGKRYHSYPSCSNMKSPREVTLSSAKSSGRAACSKCHPPQ